MPLVHRHIASKEAQDSAFRNVRTYAQAASLPVLSIHVPEPITTHNSYSMLNDSVTSDSNSTPDSDKYIWNSPKSDLTESDSDMPALIDANDASDASDTDYSDMPPLIDESNESESSGSTSDSDQEIIVNQQRYQRVRKSCKESLPCPITFSFTLWAIAMFMQCMLQLCSLTNNKCSRTL
jgi:hypothetical protein